MRIEILLRLRIKMSSHFQSDIFSLVCEHYKEYTIPSYIHCSGKKLRGLLWAKGAQLHFIKRETKFWRFTPTRNIQDVRSGHRHRPWWQYKRAYITINKDWRLDAEADDMITRLSQNTTLPHLHADWAMDRGLLRWRQPAPQLRGRYLLPHATPPLPPRLIW